MAQEPRVDLRGLEVLVLIFGIITAAALGYGLGTTTPGAPSRSPNGSSTYVLTLLEIMDNAYNASAPAQPRFFVVSTNGLTSAANLTIPSHTRIEIVIASYDMGSAPPPPQYERVTGTVGDQMTVINGTMASGTNTTLPWGETVTSVAPDLIVHTFTVPSMSLNIPMISGDTEMAYFYANVTGTFTWICMTPCGTGSDGLGGAMATPAWMLGQITVT
jgi:hypothetical protein